MKQVGRASIQRRMHDNSRPDIAQGRLLYAPWLRERHVHE